MNLNQTSYDSSGRQIESHYNKIDYLNPSILKTNPNNARTHSEKQIEQIARSINSFGFNNPILIDANNMVIAGHGRLAAASKLKLKEVPTIYLKNMSEQEKRAYIIADNKIAENSGWDKNILQIELQNLIEFETEFDLTVTGFSTPEIDLIFHEVEQVDTADVIEDDSAIPQLVEKGDLWQLGEHYLYCGDSLRKIAMKSF